MVKIYKIISENTDLVYVGSTKQRWLCDRFSSHNVQFRRFNKGIDKLWVSSFKVLEHGNCKCVLIEETDLPNREQYWIKELNACNKRKEYSLKNKERKKAYLKQYREKKKLLKSINAESN